MKKLLFTFIIVLSFSGIYAQHTFSIVAVDTATGEIGSAGATCIDAEDGAQAISDIVLGVGAIHTQSFYVPANQNNARDRMLAGDSPQEIIDFLIANDVGGNPETRQYGIVDLNNGTSRSAAFTGESCFREFIDVTGINYAIQGNILISEDVVTDMETAFLNTPGNLATKLMAALQGAKRPGADERCLSSGISSASAFIRVAAPDDMDSSYGNLSLDLNVWLNGNNFEPIDELQSQFDATLGSTAVSEKNKIILSPNPASNVLSIHTNNQTINSYTITDINGKTIMNNAVNSPQNIILINVAAIPAGTYFINLSRNNETILLKKIVIK